MSKKVVLVITDGIGHNNSCKFNSFCNAKKPTYDYLFKNIPNSLIKTSGKAVGLPDGQMGNSEVGHMSIGSGRVIYQNLVKITKAIEDKTLDKNEVLTNFLNTKKRVHIIGLLSDGGVHSHIEHIKALIKIASNNNNEVFVHALLDGRDVSPTSAIEYIEDMMNFIKSHNNVMMATVGGRVWGMDRDNNWGKIQKSYDEIISPNMDKSVDCVLEEIKALYSCNITDEFIEPFSLDEYNGVEKNDGFIFANFRNDRAKELATAFGIEKFDEFKRDNIYECITMTQYNKNFPFKVLFEPENITNTLSEVISKNGLKQVHTAETEKYAHVTFFFNGGVEEPFKNEKRVLIPSPKSITYDEKPEMSANEVCDAVLKAMDEQNDFVVVNFANGDMVGHTGNYEASIQAVECVDAQLARILAKCDEKEYSFVLTSDHGNCEEMQDKDGNTLTNHTTYDVYLFIKDENVKTIKNGGALCNIAPTILELMELTIPQEMEESL